MNGAGAALKWIMDYLLAIAAGVFLLPVLLLVAVLIRLDSPGPVLYRHRVLGKNGRPFDAIKFRTMAQNSHLFFEAHPELKKRFQENFKLKDDPRVTRFGRILRRASLDEVPQILNVLRGEMSVVGPRFISLDEVDKYGPWLEDYFKVKPGITGLWQVRGRSDLPYEERVRLDVQYIRGWSLWLDISLILATIPAVFKKKGAY